MLTIFFALAFAVLGYLFGSLTPSIWITRLLKGVDVRDSGSGHATTTNTIRQAGFGPGVLVFILDVAKGFLPTWLALRYAPAEWIIPIVAGMAVVGHCWPLFAGFRGGMGLATAGGGLLAVQPLGFLIGVGVLIILVLVIHHGARASVATGILLSPAMWVFGLRGTVIWIGIAVGLVIAFRFLIDWNRQYRELWLDRENHNNGSFSRQTVLRLLRNKRGRINNPITSPVRMSAPIQTAMRALVTTSLPG